MPFDRELYAALKRGLQDLTKSDRQALGLIWSYPGVPVRFLPEKIGQKPGGSMQLAIGDRIGKKKLWDRMPRRLKRELAPRGYFPFYSGALIRTRAVIDRRQQRFVCFDLREEAIRALQELEFKWPKRHKPSPDYKPIEAFADDNISTSQNAPAETKRLLRSIVVRRGQPRFRKELLQAYEGRCVVTGCTELKVLEAAHINPFAKRGRYKATNGILLRADWHTLFDLGMWTIHPTRLTVQLSSRIEDRDYLKFSGKPVRLPQDPMWAPDRAAIRTRYRRFGA